MYEKEESCLSDFLVLSMCSGRESLALLATEVLKEDENSVYTPGRRNSEKPLRLNNFGKLSSTLVVAIAQAVVASRV